jgi:hypothetical protein
MHRQMHQFRHFCGTRLRAQLCRVSFCHFLYRNTASATRISKYAWYLSMVVAVDDVSQAPYPGKRSKHRRFGP